MKFLCILGGYSWDIHRGFAVIYHGFHGQLSLLVFKVPSTFTFLHIPMKYSKIEHETYDTRMKYLFFWLNPKIAAVKLSSPRALGLKVVVPRLHDGQSLDPLAREGLFCTSCSRRPSEVSYCNGKPCHVYHPKHHK